ncbi:hypothetical protein AB4Z46_12355 [Variovorax sp. M-6]|uniref:hypothetical protein n=1 Tax=Variovorax sp. M-6 TaxID=3233041 RepID=UPI003F958C07
MKAEVLADNASMLAVFKASGLPLRLTREKAARPSCTGIAATVLKHPARTMTLRLQERIDG